SRYVYPDRYQTAVTIHFVPHPPITPELAPAANRPAPHRFGTTPDYSSDDGHQPANASDHLPVELPNAGPGRQHADHSVACYFFADASLPLPAMHKSAIQACHILHPAIGHSAAVHRLAKSMACQTLPAVSIDAQTAA